jgi:hypothetical protein
VSPVGLLDAGLGRARSGAGIEGAARALRKEMQRTLAIRA